MTNSLKTPRMTRDEAALIARSKPWWKDGVYLSIWACSFLTDDNQVIGWSFRWTQAIADADRQWKKKNEKHTD